MTKIFDIYGDIGTGKTILMCLLALMNYLKNPNRPTIADFKLEFPNYIPLEIDELLNLDVNDALIELDEFDVYANNRRSMSNLNIFFVNATKQTRKKKLDVVSSAQLLDTIEGRFTRLSNMSIISLGKMESINNPNKLVFGYDFVYKSIFGNQVVPLEIPLDFMATMYDKYDTFEVIEPLNLNEMVVEVKSQKKKTELINKIVDEIVKRRVEFGIDEGKLTEKKLCWILMQLEQPETLSFYVSEALKQRLNL